MTEQQGAFAAGGINSETTRAVAHVTLSSWLQMSQEWLDHSFNTVSNQVELGRRIAGSRSIGDLLDAQAELGHRAVQSSLEYGRKVAETGQNVANEIVDRIAQTIKVTAETTTQQARVTAEQFRATADQTRNAMKAAAREADQAVERVARATNGQGSQHPDQTKRQQQAAAR